MAANFNPIFSLVPNVSGAKAALAANTTTDLTAGTIYLIWTAGAEGGRLDRVRFRQLGTNVATVGRLWWNNGSTTGTAVNNGLFDELTLAASTLTQVAALDERERVVGLSFPAGYRVYVTLGTAVAAGFDVTGFGGNY